MIHFGVSYFLEVYLGIKLSLDPRSSRNNWLIAVIRSEHTLLSASRPSCSNSSVVVPGSQDPGPSDGTYVLVDVW